MEKPQNKTQLQEWLKENVGASLKFCKSHQLLDMDGNVVFAHDRPTLHRIINDVRLDAVSFFGDKEFGEELKTPLWLYLDEDRYQFEFTSKYFSIYYDDPGLFEQNINGIDVDVRQRKRLEYYYQD